MRSDLKKIDSFTLETWEKHLIRNFLRNGRLSVKYDGFRSSKIHVTRKLDTFPI